MGNRLNRIKGLFKKIKLSLDTSDIRDEIKKYLIENGHGEIVEVICSSSNFYDTCPKGYPSDYYYESNSEYEYTVRTSSGDIFVIYQGKYGFIWDGPPKRITFSLQDVNGDIIYSSDPDFQRKLQKEE